MMGCAMPGASALQAETAARAIGLPAGRASQTKKLAPLAFIGFVGVAALVAAGVAFRNRAEEEKAPALM